MKILLFTILSTCAILGAKGQHDPFKLKKESPEKIIQQKNIVLEKPADITLTAIVVLKSGSTAVIKQKNKKMLFLAVGDKFTVQTINQGPLKEWTVQSINKDSIRIISELGSSFTLKCTTQKNKP